MKKIIIIVGLAILISGGFLYNKLFKSTDNKIHYHAGFIVYIDGQRQNFSDAKYMLVDRCSLSSKTKTPQEIQLEKAHLHDGVGDVVHVHQSGAVWGDLFKNIKFTFPQNKKIIGYINHQEINDILNYPIKSYDSVIIIVGNKNNVNLNNYVSVGHIKAVEKNSELCGTAN